MCTHYTLGSILWHRVSSLYKSLLIKHLYMWAKSMQFSSLCDGLTKGLFLLPDYLYIYKCVCYVRILKLQNTLWIGEENSLRVLRTMANKKNSFILFKNEEIKIRNNSRLKTIKSQCVLKIVYEYPADIR